MAYTIIREELGFHRKFTGNFDLEDIISANIIDAESVCADDVQYVIDDLTGITSSTLSDRCLPFIVDLNKIISRRIGKLKIAIVINRDPTQIALAEKFCEQMKGSLFEASVFSTLGEARRWIATAS